jgi:hypothetical protein
MGSNTPANRDLPSSRNVTDNFVDRIVATGNIRLALLVMMGAVNNGHAFPSNTTAKG